MPGLDFKRLKAIKEKTNSFLVLHGGSGISDSNIKKGIQAGIQKININTALRAIWKKELKKELSGSKALRPYLILTPVIEKIQKKVEIYIKLFKSNNKA